MQLDAYLARIRFSAPPRPNLETLVAVHRAHQLAIPFENIDVQLRRPIDLSPEAIFDKLVTRRRGGWCYEMNGLMGWALREMGFSVTRLAAGVMREQRGDMQLGNHLCLRVDLDEPWLVDGGFGGSLFEPLPMRAFERSDTPYRIRLGEIEGGFWRFIEQAHGDPFSFDFRNAPADESLLMRQCDWLQRDPTSPFVQNLVIQRRTAETHVSLRGRVLFRTTREDVEKTELATADDLLATLKREFGLDVPEVASLWPAILARHEALFAPPQPG